ncbi:MAG TPA: hypothetical protein VFD59_00270 [Nocardioidaceae bacterium]|nr:hypothetical protein [Nocardioidaceae bacterium]
MTSPDDTRAQRLRQLEAAILEGEPQAAPESPAELSELSARAHQAIVSGTFGAEPTELRVRLHGDGVQGHKVPADQAGAVLRQTQLVVRWIGARLRALGDEKQLTAKVGDRMGIVDATRLFLQPQFGAGSLIFDLVAAEDPEAQDSTQGQLIDGAAQTNTLLDRSLQELLDIVASSQADSPEALGELSGYVSRMGPRVASQLKALALHVTDDEIDIDLRWSASGGRRRSANLGRRGALAIKDAVDRNKVKVDEITLTGLLETASTGKDQVRIDTPDDSFKMDVEVELGVTLGRWLHQEVTARVQRTVTWHDSGKETKDYKLLAIAAEPRIEDTDDSSEEVVRPQPEDPSPWDNEPSF